MLTALSAFYVRPHGIAGKPGTWGTVGAEVYIDQSLVGKVPLMLNAVPVGEHSLTLKKPGYEKWSQIVIVTQGNLPIVVDMQRQELPVELSGHAGGTVLAAYRHL